MLKDSVDQTPTNRQVLNDMVRVHNLTKAVFETNIEDEAMDILLVTTHQKMSHSAIFRKIKRIPT